MIGVAVLGLGRIGPAHARAVSQTHGATLIAIADVDDARRNATLAEHAGAIGLKDYRDALARDDVDAVLIALPHWLHAQAAIDAATAGKHIMIEKPMACTVAECDAMLDAARRARVRLMIGHTQHVSPVGRAVKQALAERRIGELIMGIDQWNKPYNPEARPAWMMDRARGGGMQLMDGVHLIDRMLWQVDARPVAVKAMMRAATHPNYPCDDTSQALVQFDNGVVVTINRIAYRTGVVQYGGDYWGTDGQLKFREPYGRTGERGVWIGHDERWEALPLTDTNGLATQFDGFIEALTQGHEVPIPGEYGRLVMAVSEAMEQSAASGREVLIDA
ncbi:MAG: Gfo/Idh/MocA family oxidoreductase [Chloroflexi bacterium]|nr:Gfo/Idh/MocA family oxidoreductase [Chloroflexota bacterium]